MFELCNIREEREIQMQGMEEEGEENEDGQIEEKKDDEVKKNMFYKLCVFYADDIKFFS